MKRIAIIADPIDNQNAGVHVYTKYLLFSLLDNDAENFYIVYREKKDDKLDKYSNCKQIVIPNFIGFTAIRKFILIPIISVFQKANIVMEPAHFGPFLLPLKIKRVTVIHDLSAVLFPQWHSLYSSTLQRIFLKRILKKADLIVSNSYFTEHEIIKHYPFTSTKIKTIYPGVMVEEYSHDNVMNVELKPYFLYVGTVEPRKNLILLLEAFKLYKETIDDQIQLYIVGAKGWKVEQFFNNLESHKFKEDIHILGYVSNELLTHYYMNCWAFIYPSIYEGFGFPVIEAMRNGATCITTDQSSMSEISYPYALYFKNNDVSSLYEKMKEVAIFKNVNSVDEIIKHSNKYNWDTFAVLLAKELSLL